MSETFYQVVHLVTVMGIASQQSTGLLRPFWTADISPSYQVCPLLYTKFELYVSDGFHLVLQFKIRYLRNFAFRGLRENTLSVKGIRGNKNGKKFWCGFKCSEDEVYFRVSYGMQDLLIQLRELAYAVSIVTRHGMEIWGSNPGRGLIFLSSSKRPDRLWAPPSVLFNCYLWLFSWEQSGWGVKLNTSIHEVPR
jgi:hypothetical protein